MVLLIRMVKLRLLDSQLLRSVGASLKNNLNNIAHNTLMMKSLHCIS